MKQNNISNTSSPNIKFKRRPHLTPVSIFHYVRLIYRSLLFLCLLGYYIGYRFYHREEFTVQIESRPVILFIAWLVFVVEMILRFFPSRLESPGSQKQFAGNYIKSGSTDIDVQDNNATILVALIWNACEKKAVRS